MSVLNETFNQTQEQRIDAFFSNSSIFVGNKFIVGFWGEYVNSALYYLLDYSNKDPLRGNIPKVYKNQNIYTVLFNKWYGNHVVPNSNDSEVDLKWACESVKIPSVGAKTRKGFNIDTTKTIDYPLIEGHEGAKTITLNIVEDKKMMFYQFFNALQNQFFEPLILKPKSSYHKLGMYIAVIGGHQMDNLDLIEREDGVARETTLEDIPMQVFEFNSVVMTGMSEC